MLLEELAKDLADVTSSLIGGRTINIMNTDGVIVASTERDRIGSFHQGARDAVRTGKVVNIRRDELERYPGAKEGCNMPLRLNGSIIGAVGIYGNPEEIQDVAHLLEVYAAKYYQLEALLRPRLSESVLREQLLTSLLSPPNSSISAATNLMNTLNIRFQFPVYTFVFSASENAGDRELFESLCPSLEVLGFLNRQCDVWGIVDGRLVLLCSQLENRDIDQLLTLSGQGFRVNLGLPCLHLWEIQEAYYQAALLDSVSKQPKNDIRHIQTRCLFLLGSTAAGETAFLENLFQMLKTAFSDEEIRILMHSVNTYYNCARSISAAAEQLFIHKNTLQYRIRRVLEALEITKLPAFWQEYLLRLLALHTQSNLRSQDLE